MVGNEIKQHNLRCDCMRRKYGLRAACTSEMYSGPLWANICGTLKWCATISFVRIWFRFDEMTDNNRKVVRLHCLLVHIWIYIWSDAYIHPSVYLSAGQDNENRWPHNGPISHRVECAPRRITRKVHAYINVLILIIIIIKLCNTRWKRN